MISVILFENPIIIVDKEGFPSRYILDGIENNPGAPFIAEVECANILKLFPFGRHPHDKLAKIAKMHRNNIQTSIGPLIDNK